MERSELKKIIEQLKAHAESLGYTVSKTGGTYGEGEGVVRLTLADKGADPWAKQAAEYLRTATWINCKPEWLNQEFNDAMGHRYTLRGYNGRARRFPMVAEREDGRRFKFAVNAIQGAFRDR